MPTRPSQDQIDLVQDVRALLTLAKKSITSLVKGDDARGTTKGQGPVFVQDLEKDVEHFERLSQPPIGGSQTTVQATRVEQQLREALRSALQGMRDDVTDSVEDEDVHRAFGVGMHLSTKSTRELLDFATRYAASYAKYADAVKASGVDDKRMAQLAKLRAELAGAEAEATQRESAGEGPATEEKTTLFESLKRRAEKLRLYLEHAMSTASGEKEGAARATLAGKKPAAKKLAAKKPAAKKPAAKKPAAKKSGAKKSAAKKPAAKRVIKSAGPRKTLKKRTKKAAT